jgi:hypothetical protein
MKNKKFDCVKMVRDIRDKIYEEQKGMTKEEKLAYYHQKAVEARKVQESAAHYGKDK